MGANVGRDMKGGRVREVYVDRVKASKSHCNSQKL